MKAGHRALRARLSQQVAAHTVYNKIIEKWPCPWIKDGKIQEGGVIYLAIPTVDSAGNGGLSLVSRWTYHRLNFFKGVIL